MKWLGKEGKTKNFFPVGEVDENVALRGVQNNSHLTTLAQTRFVFLSLGEANPSERTKLYQPPSRPPEGRGT